MFQKPRHPHPSQPRRGARDVHLAVTQHCVAIPRGLPLSMLPSHQSHLTNRNGRRKMRWLVHSSTCCHCRHVNRQLNGARAAAASLLASRRVCPDAMCCSVLQTVAARPHIPRPAPSGPKQRAPSRPYPTQRVGVFLVLFSATRRNASGLVRLVGSRAGDDARGTSRPAPCFGPPCLWSAVRTQDGQRWPPTRHPMMPATIHLTALGPATTEAMAPWTSG